MMVLAFAMYDTKVGMFGPPFFFQHRGQALRAALEVASDPQTTIGRHPADFCLFEIGFYDDQTGRMEAVNPVNMGVVASLLPVTSQNGPLFERAEKVGG